jgi:hypothetical protein
VENGKRTTAEQFTAGQRRITQNWFHCELGPRDYRQIIVELARAYLGSEYELDLEDDEEEEDALAAQAGHRPTIRRKHYANEVGMLPSLTTDLFRRYGHVSEWWWRLAQFYPGAPPLLPINKRRKIHALNGLVASDQGNRTDGFDPTKLLEHVTAVMTDSLTHMENRLQESIQASVAAGIAEFMHRKQATPAARQSMPEVMLIADRQSDIEMPGLYESPTDDLTPVDQLFAGDDVPLQLLKQLFQNRPGTCFKSTAQQQMAAMALERKHSFVTVLPTGGGKSIAYLLPALVEEDLLTLVLIPNKALLSDSLRKTKDFGISACQWMSTNQSVGEACVVFLAMESITSRAFRA